MTALEHLRQLNQDNRTAIEILESIDWNEPVINNDPEFDYYWEGENKWEKENYF
jgi:hypothetical protein